MQPVIPLDQMTTKEKLLAMEEIWESLCQSPESVPSPDWHADVLADREAKIRAGEAKFRDWDEVRKELRRFADEHKNP
jgi:hypothetical protein